MLTKGALAKTKREACGLTQSQFAVKAGLSSATISRYELDGKVDDKTVEAIENCLTEIYHNMTPAQTYRAHLKSLTARLEYCSLAEAKDVSIKIIQATAKLQWFLAHSAHE